MSAQLYLVKISAMSTCDECDIVPSAEIVVDHELGAGDVPCLAVLSKITSQLSEVLRTAPFEGVRPMTRAEIKKWRDDATAETDSVSLLDESEEQ